MQTLKLISLTVTLTAFSGMSSQADTPAEEAPPHVSGSIDIAQAQARADRMFSHVDADANGEISPQELQNMTAKRGGKWRGRPPAGHPGMPGRWWQDMQGPEHPTESADAVRGKIFEALDTDSDGLLSPQEFSQVRETTQRVIQRQRFKRLDSNSDGRLTRDEFPGFIQRLQQLDRDGNGVVTRQEMRAELISRWSTSEAPVAEKDGE